MAREDTVRKPAGILEAQVSLMGEVTEDMACSLVEQLAKIEAGDEPVTCEISTLGGDAEFARRMVLEVDLARARLKPRRLVFLGKTIVYSAGVTLMSAFPRADRFLTSDATLLIHCRQLDKTVEISGPMRSSLPQVRSLCHQIELGLEREEANFQRLIEGSDVKMDELLGKALCNWYVPAAEALKLGLIAGVIDPAEALH
jgi:ATP-dependent protease ClpP protease subunit